MENASCERYTLRWRGIESINGKQKKNGNKELTGGALVGYEEISHDRHTAIQGSFDKSEVKTWTTFLISLFHLFLFWYPSLWIEFYFSRINKSYSFSSSSFSVTDSPTKPTFCPGNISDHEWWFSLSDALLLFYLFDSIGIS